VREVKETGGRKKVRMGWREGRFEVEKRRSDEERREKEGLAKGFYKTLDQRDETVTGDCESSFLMKSRVDP